MMCKKLFLLISFVLLLGLAGSASAAGYPGDVQNYLFDFESYTSTTELRATWSSYWAIGGSGGNRALDDSNGVGGSQVIRLTANTGTNTNGYGGRAQRNTNDSTTPHLNWTGKDGIRLWIKALLTPADDVNFPMTFDKLTYRVRFQEGGSIITTSGDWWRVDLPDGSISTYGGIPINDPTYGVADPNVGGYVFLPWSVFSHFDAFTTGNHNALLDTESIIRLQVEWYYDLLWGGGNMTYAVGDNVRIWYDDIIAIGGVASGPSPADGTSIEAIDPNLTWVPGYYTQPTVGHEVYFGSDFADVNTGTGAIPQDANFYDPGVLVSGVQYYWRVDEVNAADGNSPWRGDVWRFTVGAEVIDDFESYADTAALQASWASSETWASPNTVFTRSLDTTGGSGSGSGQAILLDWDPNSEPNSNAGTGYDWGAAKNWWGRNGIRLWIKADSNITTDPNYRFRVRWWDFDDQWSSVDLDLTDPCFASGKEVFISWYDFFDYGGGGNDGMEMGQAERMYLRFDYTGTPPAGSNATVWVDNIIALTDTAYASAPSPAINTTGIQDVTPTISWTAGDSTQDVDAHDIYLGDSWYSVHNAANSTDARYQGSQDLSDTNYIAGPLAFSTTYFWRIDEVNAADGDSPWRSVIWDFTTADFHNVDNFNDYADTNDMNDTWTAGGDANMTLSIATVGGNGSQTMQIDYNNVSSNSWAYRAPESTDVNWTMSDIEVLRLWFYGDAGNDALPLYVRIEDGGGAAATIEHTDPNAVQLAPSSWPLWYIDLQTLADTNSVDLTDIVELRVGVGDGITPGAGTIWIDGFRLYASDCHFDEPTNDLNGDCVVNFEDFALILGNWLDEQVF